jgi:hypothetical protein
LLLRLLLFSIFLFPVFSFPCAARAQSPVASDAPARPAILGDLEKGKYSNPVIGFELQLDSACSFADEDRARAWSTQFPQRLSLRLRCGDDLFLLSSYPLHADEPLDLGKNAQVSLQGAVDAGGFKKRGRWQKQTAGGTEVWIQELSRHGDSGQELGFYYAFLIGRRYVSILAIGPEGNEAKLSQAAAALRIEQKTAP